MNNATEIRQQSEGAIARLRLLAEADMQDTDEQELICFAALVVGTVADPERRHALAEALIGALTVRRFRRSSARMSAGAARRLRRWWTT